MLNRFVQMALKKYGLDKYLTDVALFKDDEAITTEFHLIVGNGKHKITVGFNVVAEYRDDLNFALKFLS
jgi:hypothetical protein